MFAMSDEDNYRCRVLIFIYLTFVCRHRRLRSVCVSFDISKQLLRVSQNLILMKKGSERDLSFLIREGENYNYFFFWGGGGGVV